jgi:hypothetical protein
MASDSDWGLERISTKKLAILFGLAFAAAIFMIQFIQGFPIKDLFQSAKTEVVTVSIKQDQTCVVTPSDEHPREIPNCSFQKGQNLTITYSPSSASIISYQAINK